MGLRWRLGALSVVAAVVTIAVSGLALFAAEPALHRAHAAAQAGRATASYAQVPIGFAPGERDSPARFVATGAGYSIFLTERGSLLELTRAHGRGTAQLRTTMVGARAVRPRAERSLPGRLFVYHGGKKRENIPTFARVRFPGVYPGIDATYHGSQSGLEYDYEVAAGADPGQIALRLGGPRSLRLASNGDLLLAVPGGAVRESRPVAYQTLNGHRVAVSASFVVVGSSVRFSLGHYDHSRPLVIDPEVSFATYLGGAARDRFNSISLAPDGSIYVAGASGSLNYPGTVPRSSTDEDMVVSRLSADGKLLLFSTQVGGKTVASGYSAGFETDEATDVAADFIGAMVVGYTQTTDFATTNGTADTTLGTCTGGGRSGFLVWVQSTGALTFKRCFGGNANDTAESVAVRFGDHELVDIVGTTASSDSWGAGAITGYKSSPSGGSRDDAFIMEVDVGANPDVIRYRSFLNGDGYTSGTGVALDSSGIYFTGDTNSTNIGGISSPSPGFAGQRDAYVGKIALSSSTASTATSLSFLTYFGTSGLEHGRAIGLGTGAVYIVGDTDSDSLPLKETSGNLTRGQGQDGFIAKFDTSGVLSSSTYVGGDGTDSLEDIAVQSGPNGNAEYAIGTTDSGSTGNSNGFTTRNAVPGQTCSSGDTQALLVKRIDGASPPGAIISCLGGNDADGDFGNGIAANLADSSDGTIYVAGTTGGGFPGMNGYQTTFGGYDSDGFVAKLTQKPPTIDSTPPPVVGNTPAHLTFSTTEAGMAFSCSSPVNGNFVAGTRSPSSCPTVGSADYGDLADGPQTFEVASVDAFGSESAPVTTTFTVDKTPPAAFDLKSPADGDVDSTGSPAFSWAATSDLHAVTSYQVVVDDKTVRTVDSSACSGGTCLALPSAPLTNGTHTWRVVASDGASPANTQSSASRKILIGSPPAARFSIAPNPALAGNPVTFDASASNDATHTISHFEWDLDGDGTFETDGGSNPVTTKSYADPVTASVSLRVTDSAGLTATLTQQLRVTAPSTGGGQVGVSINKGAQYTNDPNVMLTIVAPPNTTSLLVANDGGFVGAIPQPLAKTVAWKLDSSGPERLPKTVYVRFLINTFASSNYTDDIILDEIPPVVQSASLTAPAASAAGGATAAKAKTYVVKVKAKDSNSGVGKVQIAANKRKPGKLLAYAKKFSVQSAARPKFLRVRDRAGNFSPWKKLR